MAYLRGDIELQHPPVFLKATMPVLERAMMEQVHERLMEATLTANIPPQVQLRKSMTRLALFQQLFVANSDVRHGKEMMDRLMQDVKMLYYDGLHTLKFIFHSRRIAQFYDGILLRLQRVVIDLEDSGGLEAGIFNPAQLKRLYSVRVSGITTVGIATLINAFTQLAGVPVLDAERPRMEATTVVDNRFYTVRFSQEHCPEALQGVTQVRIGSTQVVLHHHLIHRRRPCSRCYSPKHTTGYCKVKPEHLQNARDRGCRIIEGSVNTFRVGEHAHYRRSDEDSFDLFWTNLVQELRPEHGENGGISPAPCLIQPSALVTAAPGIETGNPQTPQSAADQTTTDGDFEIVRRKRPQQKKAAADAKIPVPGVASNSRKPPVVKSSGKQRSGKQSRGTAAPQADRSTTKPVYRPGANLDAFRLFQREREYGQFQGLMEEEDESDSDDASAGDARDDAAYAFPEEHKEEVDSNSDVEMQTEQMAAPREATLSTSSPDTSAAEQQRQAQRASRRQRLVEDAEQRTEFVDVKLLRAQPEVDSDVNMSSEDMCAHSLSPASSYVGSSAPSQSPPSAPTPGSEAPFSLVSDSSDMTSDQLAQEVPGYGPLTCSQGSEDSVIYEKTVGPTVNPTQAHYWLSWFNGAQVNVPVNGQCAMLALYATISNTAEGQLALTREVITDANYHKQAIYALMIANLQDDCALGLVDPVDVVGKLYPGYQQPATNAAVQALLCTHLLHERLRSVDVPVPSTHWAGPHFLRACAQYLRQPLLVIDVNSAGDGHLQIYSYQDHDLILQGGDSPDTHETGVYTHLSDEAASTYLQQCGRLHVLPAMMLVRNHESHFYGVRHGELSYRWQAEGDPSFASAVAQPYDWVARYLAPPANINVTITGKSSRVEVGFEVAMAGKPVDLRDDTDATNEILHRGLTMRQRMDVVHLWMGWPILATDVYDVDELVGLMHEAERQVLRAAGVDAYAAGLRPMQTLPREEPHDHRQLRVFGNLHADTYQQLLAAISLTDMAPAINIKFQAAHHANEGVVRSWRQTENDRASSSATEAPLTVLVEALLAGAEPTNSLRKLFATLPYPELAAKMLPPPLLQRWGRLEVYRTQMEALTRLARDPDRPAGLISTCQQWIDEATGPDQARILEVAADAGDGERSRNG